MTPPDPATLAAAMEATWPALRRVEAPGWSVRVGAGGGKRVSAATATAPDADIGAMEAAQAAVGQPPLAMVRPGEQALDDRLAAAGYALADPVTVWCASAAALAREPERMTAFTVQWPPLAVQREIWSAAGIGPGRFAVMERAAGPKCSLLGRCSDRPAGAAFVALNGSVALLHALEVAPAFRRRRVAHNMMCAAALWALDLRAAWLCVLVTQANHAANALYSSLGMTSVGHYHYRTKFLPQGRTLSGDL